MRAVAILAVMGLSWLAAPALAAAASNSSFDDPVGDTLEFAPDLGATTLTVGDDETIAVDTRIVPRPPAFWGGCAYYVGFPPFQTCVPSNMNVTWYVDYASGSGSVADDGADAKVVVVPSSGQTFWESARWDAANGKFSAGAQPAGSEDEGGARWTLRLADLGIPRPATVRIWVVSLYKSYNGLGVLLDYSDKAGPGTVAVDGPPPAGGATAACTQTAARVNKLQRKLRAAKRRGLGKKGGKARTRLRLMREKRRRALRAMKRNCGPASDAPGQAPTSAPPGCHLVTKPVLQQEGIGIHAQWVVKPEVVVECGS